MVSEHLYLGFLGLLALERVGELWLSRRNAAWAFAQGGVERGQAHFRWMKLLHTLFLFACAAEVLWWPRAFVPELGYPMLAVALLAQGLRYWAIGSLGTHWNVRVIVVPGAQAVRRGPYRFLRHPNYLAVILEGLAVPLMHSAIVTAALFTVLNAWLLVIRIRCEEAALSEHCNYDQRLGNRRRLIPAAPSGAGELS